MQKPKNPHRQPRRWITPAAMSAVLALTFTACSADETSEPQAEAAEVGGALIIGMTSSNIPLLDTAMASSEGGEGWRFVGNQLYDGLTRWDLSDPTSAPTVEPALAESWTWSDDLTTWEFVLRDGIVFHDGTPWDADAAIYNLGRYVDQGDPQFYEELRAAAAEPIAGVESFQKIDDMTIEVTTTGPWANLPSDLTTLYFASPTAVEELGNDGFAESPVGTGPFMFEELVVGQQLTMSGNPDYWRSEVLLDTLILQPIPDTTARVAALQSGSVNWIEAPTPDDSTVLSEAGFTVHLNSYDHQWLWMFDTTQEPFDDVRVRQAFNFAINRESLSDDLLQGTAEPLYQFAPSANFAYREENDLYSYDPAEAVRLLEEAGYADGLTVTLVYPTSGSGNMFPTPMNEVLQADLADVGVTIELQPIEWSAMLQAYFVGEIAEGAAVENMSLSLASEGNWSSYLQSDSPYNLTNYDNSEVDALYAQAKQTGDMGQRGDIYAEAAAIITDEAPYLFVVSDMNPRATATTVHGFENPKSWYVDLTTVWVED